MLPCPHASLSSPVSYMAHRRPSTPSTRPSSPPPPTPPPSLRAARGGGGGGRAGGFDGGPPLGGGGAGGERRGTGPGLRSLASGRARHMGTRQQQRRGPTRAPGLWRRHRGEAGGIGGGLRGG